MKKLSLLIFVILTAGVVFAQDDHMLVHYINVGQGNAALLEFPCGAVLIDAGGQDVSSDDHLIDYLDKFFQDRQDLNHTLDLVIITHDHKDHNRALLKVASRYTIKNYIDNGLTKGSGEPNQSKMQQQAADKHITYDHYSFERITAGHNMGGMTSEVIDPIKCENVDPQIILYSGSFDKKPASWTANDFTKNGNNHSLFIKVLYGKSSFLFIGDAETAEMGSVVDYYSNTTALDADVLLVGHHAAKNATTDPFLQEVTPKYAIISCGKWYDDSTSAGPFDTYHYGHPTDSALRMLERRIPGNRISPVIVKAGLGATKFIDKTITKRIYATAWDNDIVIKATTDGRYKTILGAPVE